MKIKSSIVIATVFACPFVCAQPHLYVGGTGGYGSTTWDGLVPAPRNQNEAISISTPVDVNEGGSVWGYFAGYEFASYFAVEANYLHYPDAKVSFIEDSLFAYENEGKTSFRTKTEEAYLIAKIMLTIPDTTLRFYSAAGFAEVHRSDVLNDSWRAAPTFGLGANFLFTEHLMGEWGANYTAGFGESELSPAINYMPFLYSIFVKGAYRF